MATLYLKGTNRTILRFVQERWRDLIQISALPLILLIVLDFLHPISAAFGATKLWHNPSFLHLFLALTAYFLIYMWLYARIVLLYLLGEKSWIGFDRTTFIPTLWSFLHAMIMGAFLTLATCAAIFVIAWIPTGFFSGYLGIFLFLAKTALLLPTFFILVGSQFFIGLPAIALGGKPLIMRNFWPLTQRQGWSLSWRVAGFLIPIAIGPVVQFVMMMFPYLYYGLYLMPHRLGVFLLFFINHDMLLNLYPNTFFANHPLLIHIIVTISAALIRLPFTWLVFLVLTEGYLRLKSDTPSK